MVDGQKPPSLPLQAGSCPRTLSPTASAPWARTVGGLFRRWDDFFLLSLLAPSPGAMLLRAGRRVVLVPTTWHEEVGKVASPWWQGPGLGRVGDQQKGEMDAAGARTRGLEAEAEAEAEDVCRSGRGGGGSCWGRNSPDSDNHLQVSVVREKTNI